MNKYSKLLVASVIYITMTVIFKRLLFQPVILCHICSLIVPHEKCSCKKEHWLLRRWFFVCNWILSFPLKDVIQNDSTVKRAWHKSMYHFKGINILFMQNVKAPFFLMIQKYLSPVLVQTVVQIRM